PDDTRLCFQKGVPALRRKDDEVASVAKILHVCEAKRFSPGSRRLFNIYAVERDELFINALRIFMFRNCAGHIIEIPTCEISNSKLLDKPDDTCCFTTIFHDTLQVRGTRDCSVGQSLKAKSFSLRTLASEHQRKA